MKAAALLLRLAAAARENATKARFSRTLGFSIKPNTVITGKRSNKYHPLHCIRSTSYFDRDAKDGLLAFASFRPQLHLILSRLSYT